jgi:hypothetical protein
MFCFQCGTELPDEALFCFRCGASMPGGLDKGSTEPSRPTEDRPAAIGVREASQPQVLFSSKKGSRSSYVWLSIDLFLLVVLLALGICNLTWKTMAGQHEDAGKSAGQLLIPVIFLGFGAKRAWASLLEKEPESDSSFKKKHRRFFQVATVCSLLVLATGWAFGLTIGQRVEKRQRLEHVLSDLGRAAPKNAEFRQRLTALRSAETPTMEDYYRQCLNLEALLDEFEPQRQRNMELFKTVSRETGEYPRLQPTIELLGRINQKDEEIILVLRREVAKAKQLWSLPYYRQSAFYEREILPIQAEIERLATEELAMLREAQQRGVSLPSDLADVVKRED